MLLKDFVVESEGVFTKNCFVKQTLHALDWFNARFGLRDVDKKTLKKQGLKPMLYTLSRGEYGNKHELSTRKE